MNNSNFKKLWDHHEIGELNTNFFIFGDKKNAIIIDPGGVEAVRIAKELLRKEIEVKHVLVTHGHFDHLGWAWEVQKVCEGAKVYLHEGEKISYEPFLDRLKNVDIRIPDVWIKDEQVLQLGGYKMRVIHTPGHSPGSVTYNLMEIPDIQNDDDLNKLILNSAFVGDCIFKGSIGRVDLPFSNPKHMVGSLKKLIKTIDKKTKLYPGHGEFTTMGYELINNPYLLALKKGIDFF